MLPSLVLISVDGPYFLFHRERRRSQKGPSSCSFYILFFYLCLLQQMNYLCFFYLESLSNLCSRSHSIFSLQGFASAVITLLYLHFSSPLYHHYCSISHLKKTKTNLDSTAPTFLFLWSPCSKTIFTNCRYPLTGNHLNFYQVFLTLWVWRIHSFK